MQSILCNYNENDYFYLIGVNWSFLIRLEPIFALNLLQWLHDKHCSRFLTQYDQQLWTLIEQDLHRVADFRWVLEQVWLVFGSQFRLILGHQYLKKILKNYVHNFSSLKVAKLWGEFHFLRCQVWPNLSCNLS